MNSSPIFLNVSLPLFLSEWTQVLLFFICIVLVESTVVQLILKLKFKKILFLLFKANLVTTLMGYFLQAFLRFIMGVLFVSVSGTYWDERPVLDGIFENVGLGKYQGGAWHPAVFSSLLTSVVITCLLSIIIERKILIKKLSMEAQPKRITTSIVVANVISYVLLFFWLVWRYQKTHL